MVRIRKDAPRPLRAAERRAGSPSRAAKIRIAPDADPRQRARDAKLLGHVAAPRSQRERIGRLTYRVFTGVGGISPKRFLLGAVVADGGVASGGAGVA